jgi:cell wall-associated NlpC family hydrolase
MTSFTRALRMIPRDIARVHHGRDPGGIDCVGLWFLLYRLAGIPVDHLDGEYPPADEMTDADVDRFVANAMSEFHPVSKPYHYTRLVDGDTLILSGQGLAGKKMGNHVGVFVGNRVATMTDRLMVLPAPRVVPFAKRVFRR